MSKEKILLFPLILPTKKLKTEKQDILTGEMSKIPGNGSLFGTNKCPYRKHDKNGAAEAAPFWSVSKKALPLSMGEMARASGSERDYRFLRKIRK